MRAGSGTLHADHVRVLWAEPHGAREMFDRNFRLAEPGFHPTARQPSPGQVRIERESSFDESSSLFNLTRHPCKREPGGAERKSVALAEKGCSSRQKNGLRNFGGTIRVPTGGFTLRVTAGRHAISRGEIGIEFDRTTEMRQGLGVSLLCPEMISPPCRE